MEETIQNPIKGCYVTVDGYIFELYDGTLLNEKELEELSKH